MAASKEWQDWVIPAEEELFQEYTPAAVAEPVTGNIPEGDDAYVKMQRYLSKYKDTTRAVYRSILKRMDSFFALEQVKQHVSSNTNWNMYTAEEVSLYFRALQIMERDYASSGKKQDTLYETSSSYLRMQYQVIRSFYSYLHSEETLDEFIEVPIWKATKKKDLFAFDELYHVLDAIVVWERYPVSVRATLSLVVLLSYYAGLSRAELLKLKPSDVIMTNTRLLCTVHGTDRKKKDREIVLPNILRPWIHAHKPYEEADSFLGHDRNGKAYSPKALQFYLLELSNHLVLTKHLSIQTLRTSCIARSITFSMGREQMLECASYFGITQLAVMKMYQSYYGIFPEREK